jgi:hypothetical protein
LFIKLSVGSLVILFNTPVMPTAVRSILLYKFQDTDSTWVEALAAELHMSRTHAVPHHNTVFRQLIKQLARAGLDRLVKRHRAGKGVRRLPGGRTALTEIVAPVAA